MVNTTRDSNADYSSFRDELLPPNVYEAIRPTGSVSSRMLSKMHKKDVPLLHILSMVGSSQHSLAKWLTSILEPVLSLYLSHCVSDSFTFFDSLRNFILYADSVFLCSFHIYSSLTNVPLTDAIDICANALYNDDLPTSSFPWKIFVELKKIATTGIGFSFKQVMSQQIDGVTMGSPLDPSLANILVGFYETKPLQQRK